MIFFGIISGLVLGFFLTSPVIVLLHELGHALAHLLFSPKEQVDVFIGSYGKKSPINFRIGRLSFHIKIGTRFAGMCYCSKPETNYIKRLVVLLAGPLFSFITVCVFGFLVFSSDIHGAVKFYFFLLIIWTLIYLIVNLKLLPSADAIHSDGKQIQFVLSLKKNYATYISGLQAFGDGRFDVAAEELQTVSSIVPYDVHILRYLINSLMQLNRLTEAGMYLDQLEKYSEFNIEDMLSSAYILSVKGYFEKATAVFEQVLAKEPDNIHALSNMAYIQAVTGEPEKALPVIERVLTLNSQFGTAYSVLGFIKLEMGELEDGKSLIEQSLLMDPGYSYSYKHLASYHLKTGDKETALIHLKKANEMNEFIALEF